MIKLLRLAVLLFSLSVRRTVAFRADLLFELVVTVVLAGSSLAALAVVYTQTGELGGWRPGEAIVLLGTFQIVSGVRAAFVEPNLGWFAGQVKDGRLDAILLQPAPALFLVSAGTCAPLALAQVFLGLGVVVLGISQSGAVVSAIGLLAWLFLLVGGVVTMWATRVLVAAVVFWAFGLSLDVVYDALWQFGRYPVQLYRPLLQAVFTYVIPIALIATVPADVLVHGGAVAAVPVALAAAAGLTAVAVGAWRVGLRRYTSATS